MGAEIDRLEVQVEAQATKANNQLDKLVGKLDSLSNSLSHINSSGLSGLSSGISKFAQASSQLSNVKTTDFTRLTKNIDKLANLNTQQIVSASSAIVTLSNAVNSLGSVSANSMQVVDVANSIGKLGGASVQKAITNLPALATAMNDLMTTLSKAPSVNRNIIDMTKALTNLASQGAKVGTAGKSLAGSVNNVGSAMSATTKKAFSLSSALGSVYQRYFWLMRGANKLWDSIENSMNYVEVLNYFDAAMQQVSANAGESSADAYFESFSSRAKELTSKMTGFNINDGGTLTASGAASLGINPTKLMNYQATFAQMSSSIGVASETSLKLSQALTEIGADLASVKNMDFDKVWTDMASGLVGMSRTLDKYGVNIRNVNLQQKLFDLGIEENITNLNQNDKALLRAIILLDSTKYAWGDLADTLEQPANQLRLLESNFSNLSRTLGNLFLPVVSKLLPYVNGLVIGLQRLFAWVGNLLGIDLSGITSAVGDSAVDIGDLLDEADGASDALGSAAKNAEKLKKFTMGIDELNINSPQDDSSSGSGSIGGISSGLLDEAFEKSFAEYQKVWDEAFANMENRANQFADKVEKFLQPVRDIIEDFAIGDFFKAGHDTSNLVAGIFNFFADAIDNVDWYAIGENIGEYLAGVNWIKALGSIGHLIWEALKASLELWAGAMSTAPIETALISMVAMPKLLKALASTSMITGVSKLAKNVKLITTAFAGNKKSMSTLLTQYPKLGKAVDVARDSFLALKTGISDGHFFTGANLAIENIRNNLTGLQKGVITAVAGFAEFEIVSHTFEGLVDGSENLVAGIAKIGGAAGVASLAMYTALGPAGLAVSAITGLVAAVKGINDAFSKREDIELYGDSLDTLTEKINGTSGAIKERIENSRDYVNGAGLAEATMAQDLADKYFALAEKENLTNEEKQEMQALAKTLVDTLPDLEQYYNTQTGLLDTTRQSIDGLINSRLNEIKLSAVEDELKEAYSAQIDAVNNLNDALEIANASREKMNQLQAEYDKYAEKLDLLQKYNDLSTQISETTGDTSALLEESEKLWNEITNNGETPNLANYDYLISKMGEASEEVGRFSGKYTDAMNALNGATEAYELSEQAISEFSDMLISGMTEAANNSVSGYANGLENNKQAAEASYNLARDILSEFARGQDSHSPSKEFAKLGKDAVDGYNLGITNSTKSTFSTIAIYIKSILQAFSSLPNTLYDMGIQSMNGLLNGMSSMESALYDKANSIADNIAKTIQTALDIHSPSRVMFELGEFTMAGFQNGLESMYQSTENSLKGFSINLQSDIPDYTASYRQNRNPMQFSSPSINEITADIEFSNSEQNLLLSEQNQYLREQNQLLMQILEKDNTVAIGDREIARASLRGQKAMGLQIRKL